MCNTCGCGNSDDKTEDNKKCEHCGSEEGCDCKGKEDTEGGCCGGHHCACHGDGESKAEDEMCNCGKDGCECKAGKCDC